MSTQTHHVKPESVGIEGIVTIINYRVEGRVATLIDFILGRWRNMPNWLFEALVAYLVHFGGGIEKKATYRNLVTTAGRTILTQILAGDTAYLGNGKINYGALGTGTNAAANGDTQLQTEVYRNEKSTGSNVDNSLTIKFYYSKADTNGTYNEWGTFIDATSTANSGTLFNRTLPSGGWTKTASQSMIIVQQFNIN